MEPKLKKLIEQINAKAPTFNGSIRALEQTDAQRADGAEKRFELSFSSEDAYERWFGMEILGHADGEVRLDWIASGNAPLLLQHNHDRLIGVIESAALENGRGTAVVRFGKGELAQEIKQDVEDGIRRNVSVGYRVHEMKLIKESENTPDEYRVTDWEPHEISIVSVPADRTVGTNRQAEPAPKQPIETKQENTMNPDELKKMAKSLGLSEDASLESVMDAARKAGQSEAQTEARAEISRREAIEASAKQHGLEADAQAFIREGKSAEAFNAFVLKKYSDGHNPLAQMSDFSKSEQKDLSGFSLLRAMSLIARGQKLDGVEADVMGLGVEEAQRCGIDSAKGNSFMVPSMLLRATAMSSTAAAGGTFIPTVTSSNVIDTLRNRMIFGRMGGRIMTGLAGTLKLPKVTTSPAASSLAEVGEVTAATIVTGELSFTPHRIGATLPYSNQLFLQSSPDVNAFVQDQLLMACAQRADYLGLNGDGTTDGHWYGILNYSGVNSVASGDNGKEIALSDVIGLETECAADNADVGNLAYLTSARGRGIMKQTEKVATTGKMLWEDGMVNGYRGEVSNQVPSNVTKGSETTNTTSLIFGDWDKAILGFFGGQEVVIDPYTLAAKAQTVVTVNMFADFDLEQAAAFAVMDGVHQS